MMLKFDYAIGLHGRNGEALNCFEIAGPDQLFYPATAEVVGDQIKVWSDMVKNPKTVRYGWQPFTRANLVNEEELPASTFITE